MRDPHILAWRYGRKPLNRKRWLTYSHIFQAGQRRVVLLTMTGSLEALLCALTTG